MWPPQNPLVDPSQTSRMLVSPEAHVPMDHARKSLQENGFNIITMTTKLIIYHVRFCQLISRDQDDLSKLVYKNNLWLSYARKML